MPCRPLLLVVAFVAVPAFGGERAVWVTPASECRAVVGERIHARLPGLRMAASAEQADLLVTLERKGAASRLTLSRTGDVPMRRELPSSDCGELAAAVSVLVDRYVAELVVTTKDPSWDVRPRLATPRPPELPPVPEPSPTPLPPKLELPKPTPSIPAPRPAPRVEPQPNPSPAPAPTPPPPEPPPLVVAPPPEPEPEPAPAPPPAAPPAAARTFHLETFVLGGAWVMPARGVVPSLHLDAAVRFRFYRLGLHGALALLPLDETVTIESELRGSLGTRASALHATAGVCLDTRVTLCGSVLAGVRFATGWTSGARLYARDTGTLVRPSLGALGSARFDLVGPLGLAGILSISAPLGAAGFAIEGVEAPLGNLPVVDVAAALGVSLRF